MLSIQSAPIGCWRWVMNNFMNLFRFDSTKALHIGVEQECFLADVNGVIRPLAAHVLSQLPKREQSTPYPQYGYELSACQLESKIGPCTLNLASKHLWCVEEELRRQEKSLGFKRVHSEVGPEDMPLDVYPDPSGRYQAMVKMMPHECLVAACRVIGTHVHIGMPNHQVALRTYNHVIKKCDWLCSRGNGSFGERLDIYRKVAPDCEPPHFEDWSEFYKTACEKEFDGDPRNCWTLIRISKHGTIEFRMFGATASVERVINWVTICHDLCAEVAI